MTPILQHLGVHPWETILVGNDDEDMYAGVNNGLLLVRPGGIQASTDGFKVSSISELAAFANCSAFANTPSFGSWTTANYRSAAWALLDYR